MKHLMAGCAMVRLTIKCLRIPELASGKFSKSRGAAVNVPYSLSKYDPERVIQSIGSAQPWRVGAECSVISKGHE